MHLVKPTINKWKLMNLKSYLQQRHHRLYEETAVSCCLHGNLFYLEFPYIFKHKFRINGLSCTESKGKLHLNIITRIKKTSVIFC